MTELTVDLAVVGTGPAGLAAAVTAAQAGARVAVVDLNPRIGGQYWRHGVQSLAAPGQHGTTQLRRLAAGFDSACTTGALTALLGQQVWQASAVDGGFTLRTTATTDPAAPGHTVHALRVLVATGAYDRQLPVPGWTLPGVMAAGGVQAMLKEHGQLVGRRVVVAGTGPFLLSVAAGLAEAGARVAAVCEYNAPTGWLTHPLGAVSQPAKFAEGTHYISALLRHHIPHLPRTAVTAVHGTDGVESVTVARVRSDGALGGSCDVEADSVAFGWGFTPQLELIEALGARTRVDSDGSLVACVDGVQRTSVAGLYAAGESTGVGGAAKAVAEGELAALAVLHDSGTHVDTRRVVALRVQVRRARAFARALAAATALPPTLDALVPDAAVVCRCEEITAGQVRQDIRSLELEGSRSAKITTRAGMGWCQGRECGLAVTCLTRGTDPDKWSAADLAAIAKRRVVTPVPVAELARTAATVTEN